VTVLETKMTEPEFNRVFYGDVNVVTQVVGYKKLKFAGRENLGLGTVCLPEQELLTAGVWFEFPLTVEEATHYRRIRDIAAGLTGALTAIHNVASVILMCDPRDIGTCVSSSRGEWTARMDHLGTVQINGQPSPHTRSVSLFVYDYYPGGIGLSEQLFHAAGDVVHRAHQATEMCDCAQGCPACIGPVGASEMDVKDAALTVLRFLSGHTAVSR